ncbi:MAG: tRNA 2-thiocytidine(32) synthetase TtcA [Desulfobulbaceae bacterium]
MMLPRGVNRRIGQAMHDYAMLADNDRVLVAVSGGVDSLFLAWLLPFWLRKAPITCHVHAVHIDMEPGEDGPGEAAKAVLEQLAGIGVDCTILPTIWQPPRIEEEGDLQSGAGRDICYTCARHRRKQLFDFARRKSFGKIALGHHRDDLIETFFLNICFAGNISTMVPRQDLFEGRLSLIRPLALLDKEEIVARAGELGLRPVRTRCPLSERTRRMEVRQLLGDLYERIPGSRMRIFAALSNVRGDYLLRRKTSRADRATG